MIVWLSSFPRSGNTMFRNLLFHLYGVRSYSLYDESLKDGRDGKGVADASMFANGIPEFVATDAEWHFVKTHEGPIDEAPAICLVRDGRDAFVSYAHFCRAYLSEAAQKSFEQVLRELIESKTPFNSWTAFLTAWSNRSPFARTIWVRYEDLVQEPSLVVERCLNQLEFDLPKVGEAIPDFADMQRRWPKFYRKGRVGSWRDEMPEELQRLFLKHHGAMMERFGYLDENPAD